jgi:hypothetical protein
LFAPRQTTERTHANQGGRKRRDDDRSGRDERSARDLGGDGRAQRPGGFDRGVALRGDGSAALGGTPVLVETTNSSERCRLGRRAARRSIAGILRVVTADAGVHANEWNRDGPAQAGW